MTIRITYVFASALLLIGMCLYVPYEVDVLYPADGSTPTETEYTFYWNPPETDGVYRIVRSAELDTEQLGLQLGITVILLAAAGFAVFTLSSNERGQGSRRARSSRRRRRR